MTRKQIKRHNLKVFGSAVGLAVLIITCMTIAYGTTALSYSGQIAMACVFPGMLFYHRLEDATDSPKPPQP